MELARALSSLRRNSQSEFKVLKAFGGSGEICAFEYGIFLDLPG